MASKADLLKKNANKTGKGLFAGMTPIKEESNAIFEKKEEPITEAKNAAPNSILDSERIATCSSFLTWRLYIKYDAIFFAILLKPS